VDDECTDIGGGPVGSKEVDGVDKGGWSTSLDFHKVSGLMSDH
jgi:hypothetical protein